MANELHKSLFKVLLVLLTIVILSGFLFVLWLLIKWIMLDWNQSFSIKMLSASPIIFMILAIPHFMFRIINTINSKFK
jgi:TRAP-type C4-dicarboxylate transport system permease small subunit